MKNRITAANTDDTEALRRYAARIEAELAGVQVRLSALEAANERLRLIERAMASSTEGIAILDARAGGYPLVYVNAGFERQTGYSVEEVLGESAYLFHGPETSGDTLSEVRAAMDGGEAWTGDIRVYRKDQSSFWSRMAITPLHDDKGVLTHYVVVQSDVTERIQSTQEVTQALNLLEATNIKLTKVNHRMKRNLEAAAKVQQSLLPERLPHTVGVRFSWKFRPSEDLAGDLLNVFRLDDDHVGAFLLDVTGHGTAAALLAVSVNRILMPQVRKTSLVRERDDETATYRIVPPSEVADRLNIYFPWDPDTAQFFTLVYGVLNVATRTFTFVTAGHPGPVHYPNGSDGVVMESTGLPIGLSNEPYQNQVLQLGEGDRVFLYSDGVSECMNEHGELFGRGRLTTAFNCPGCSLDTTLDNLIRQLEGWRSGGRFRDDLSLLSFEIEQPCEDEVRRRGRRVG